MLHIEGLPLDSLEVSWLVNALVGAWDTDSIEVAEVLWFAAEEETVIVALTPANRAALLRVLDNPPVHVLGDPPGGLAQLRRALARDDRDRR